jgi:hypothetical protein
MVLSRTDTLLRGGGRPGVRTGIGTYINYLLATGILAAAAVSASLARGGRKTSAPARAETDGPPSESPARPANEETK